MEKVKKGSRKELERFLKEKYGGTIKDWYEFYKKGNKIYLTNKKASQFFEILRKIRGIRIERVGIKFATKNKSLRLSMDAPWFISPNKGIIELPKEKVRKFMQGKAVDIKKDGFPDGYYIIKSGKDFLGIGLKKGNKLKSYIPKERRIA